MRRDESFHSLYIISLFFFFFFIVSFWDKSRCVRKEEKEERVFVNFFGFLFLSWGDS